MAVQTQIQTRRGAAATWTSTNPTLAAGEIGFESDTNKFKIGTGSTAWVSLPYASNVSPLTTKGDLYGFSTTNARLAVGADGESLVADSSTATGLSYAENYAAGKNKIINGSFDNWQRGTSAAISDGTFARLADRFHIFLSGTFSATQSQQTFTPGTAPASGYEGQFFWRNTISSITGSLSLNRFGQKIEDVRTLAGQTVTVSFWAKAGGSASWTPQLVQDFGSGGSSAVFASGSAVSVTTAWQRFSQTITLPSISGKTIGTGSNLAFIIDMPTTGAQTNDVWGVQVEAGSVATAFQTATGTIQGELAACQRYYYKWVDGLGSGGVGASMGLGANYNATQMNLTCAFPVTMRSNPTLSATSGTNFYKFERNGAQDDFNSLTIFHAGVSQAMLYNATEISGTAGQAGSVSTQSASAIVAFSAEL